MVLARSVELLSPDGMVHIVVDDDSYAAGLHAELSALPVRPIEPPPLPETKYGRRARVAGRTVHQISYRKAI